MRRRIQVLVLDEESLVRDGLCALLHLDRELSVLGANSTLTDVAQITLPSEPDVVIADISQPDAGPQQVLAAIKERWKSARVLVLTYCREDKIMETALRSGADGYLLKTDSQSELANAIRSVAEGKRYVSPSIFDRVVRGYVKQHELARQRDGDGLSVREREVLRRIALGYRTREIAQQLSLSHKTIEKHRSNLMRKLGLRTATAVAAYAITNGYLEQP